MTPSILLGLRRYGSCLAALVSCLLMACSPGTPETMLVEPLASPAGAGSQSPRLALTGDGNVVLSWLEQAGADSYELRYSTLEGDSWSPAAVLASGSDWFINWADFPAVVPIQDETWAAYWLVKRAGGTYAYDIALALSADAGASWSAPFTPHDDGTPTEHGFVSLFPWQGDVGVVWLDGRNMQPDDGQGGNGHGVGAMSLRYARFTADGVPRAGGQIDDHVCECCQTAVAVGSAGPVLAYRGRTAEEIRDIEVRRFAGDGWSEPQTLGEDNWRIPGCPVNGPAIAASGDTVVVGWYAAPERQSRVAVAFSADAGATFSRPVIVDQDRLSGRVDVALLADGSAVLSWAARSEEGGGELRIRRVWPNGDTGPIQVVARGDVSRSAGFPQMVRSGEHLVFAWTEPGEPSRVVTARLAW